MSKKIDITRSHLNLDRGELEWGETEVEKVTERIINLRPDQIGALAFLVGVKFSEDELEEVVSEIKENGHNSVNIGAIVYEAESKEKLLWWLGYFERVGKA